jgi:hypothetical protein
MLGLRRGEKKSGALFSTEGRGNHPPFLSLPFSSSPTNHGRELIHRQRRAPAGSPLAPPPPPTAGCAAAAMASSHGRMRRCSPSRPDAPPPPWPPPAPPPRGPLPPFFSMRRRRCPHLPLAVAPPWGDGNPRSLRRAVLLALPPCVLLDGLRPRATPLEELAELAASRRQQQGDTPRGKVCGAYCKRVSHVFQMSHKDVARVSCGCCKSRSRFFNIAGC